MQQGLRRAVRVVGVSRQHKLYRVEKGPSLFHCRPLTAESTPRLALSKAAERTATICLSRLRYASLPMRPS